jgi:hypothetical protein
MVKGGGFTAVNYISREQWAAAKSLHQYWFPEEQPKPEGYCDVCGDTHCIHELYPGICAEYDGGMVSLDLAKSIYNGDYEPSGPDSYCDVCGDTHLIGVPYPGVCEAYAAGDVPLDMAKAIYSGDFRQEKAEDSMNKTSDLVHRSIICPEHGLQDGLTFCPDCLADQASAREDELSRRAQIDICTQLGAFTSPEEDEAWQAIAASRKACTTCGGMEGVHGFGCNELLGIKFESAKQPRYKDAGGEDWIDEAARTFTAEEFRGAMRFTLGKYVRRAGKKDALESEIEKIRDYAARWLEVESNR